MGNGRYRVLLLDTKQSNPNHYICIAIERALRKLPTVELVTKADLHDAVATAIEHRCDLFFAFDGEELHPGICARLRNVCGRSILWVTEDPYEIDVNVRNAKLFDIVFTNDSASVARYEGRARHLPLAGALPFHFLELKTQPSDFRYDVFFAGTAWPNRVTLLNALLRGDRPEDRLRAKIALPTNEHLPKFQLPLPRSQLNWRTSPVDFARFANMSLATLVLPRVFSSSGTSDFAETPPPRLFEAALAGTVQLVQSNLVEARRYFEPATEFLSFNTAEDVIEQLHALRKDPQLRHDIALSAQRKALELHCYEHRVAEIMQEVQRRGQVAQAPAMPPQARPRLLFVVHNTASRGHFGGVEVYLHQLGARLGQEFEVLFWLPNAASEKAGAVLLGPDGEELKRFSFSAQISLTQLTCSEREAAFAQVLSSFDISLVHFHHLMLHVPSLVQIAKALGVPSAMTFHDFYAVCHNFLLLSFKGTYCQPDQISLKQCDVCLWSGHHMLPGSQAARRAFWDRVVEATDLLVFNTAGGQALAGGIYPSVARHPQVQVLPVPVGDAAERQRAQIPCESGCLRIAVIGNFSAHKGSDTIARVIPLLAAANVEFHLFGRIDAGYAWLQDKARFPRVHVYGLYEPGAIPEEVHACHVSLHLSIWPETYCLTLSEAWDYGLVPIVSDIGALGERVTHLVDGLKIAAQSEGELVQAILALVETPGLLGRLQDGIANAPISRSSEHFSRLAEIYRTMIARSRAARSDVAVADLTYASLNMPLVQTHWAISAGSPAAPISAQLSRSYGLSRRQRLAGLLNRASVYYRSHGMKSTALAVTRYLRRKL